jgi:hypothetical protein
MKHKLHTTRGSAISFLRFLWRMNVFKIDKSVIQGLWDKKNK